MYTYTNGHTHIRLAINWKKTVQNHSFNLEHCKAWCLCCHVHIFFLTVPASAPVLNITFITATSIGVAWQPLPSCEENGVITNYTIAYRMESGMDMSFVKLVVPAANLTAVVSPLIPYTNYTIKMVASTSVGRGEFGPEVTVQTSEAGIYDSDGFLFFTRPRMREV